MNIPLRLFLGLSIMLWSLLAGGCATAPTAPDPSTVVKTEAELGTIVNLAQTDVKPVPRRRTGPRYPLELRRAGVSGEAVVEFVIDTDGVVQAPRVVRATHPAFGEAAVATVLQWSFSAGMINGQAVATRMQVPIVFTMTQM